MPNLIASLLKRLPISRRVLEACAIALVLILAAFPDVVFNHASLRLTDQVYAAVSGIPLRPFYPIPNSIGWWAGYNDNGGAIYQSEPMIEFMVHAIKTGESPYWNPYSAAGALGPEALVDQKFSAITLVNAILGGGSLVFNVVILMALYFGVFFTYRIVREILGLSPAAATAASVFYLLNGYITANLGSNVTQSYFYVPVCIYTALMFIERASVFRWSMAVFAFALFFSCTFMPTTITSLIAIGIIVGGFLIGHVQSGRYSIRLGLTLILMLGMSLLAAVLLLAPLYFPLMENLRSIGTLEDYSKRNFSSLRFPNAVASFFSSSHFFESYNAAEPNAVSFEGTGLSFTGNTVFHSGVIAIGLAGCAIAKRFSRFKWLVVLCQASCAFVVVRLFDPIWIQVVFSKLPIIGNIGSQYWWPVIMFPMVVLIGVGVNNLQFKNFRMWPSVVLMFVGVCALVKIYYMFGLQSPRLDYKIGALMSIVMLVVLIGILLVVHKWWFNTQVAYSLLLIVIVVMFAELLVSGKMIRFQRNDLFNNMPPALQYVKNHIGVYRTLNFGQSGLYPELGSAFNIQEMTTLNQGGLPAYRDFFYSSIDLESSQRLGAHPGAPLGSFPSLISIRDLPERNSFDWKSIDFIGVKYLLLPSSYTAYQEKLKGLGFNEVYRDLATVVIENRNVAPRVFSVSAMAGGDKEEAVLSEDYRKHLVPASIDTYRNAEVVISGEVEQESLVVLTDNWHANWAAVLNGKKVPIIKVNKAFRGVVVPAGKYIIRMEYQPRTLPWAIAASLSTLLLLMILIARRKHLDPLVHRRLGLAQ
ncbi:hypothetical protein [Pseudomonas brassicacearum]|uniref:hypothetical protein n=1 Tax=Pseudomonas brassicacearum TaxID=930166 RepID=UPI0011CD7FBA|nr:hypothetical protein [Pseudomonas brassicacearum]